MQAIEEGVDYPGGTPFHEGDPEWRAADIVYEYDEIEIRELARCAQDVVYFANNYCKAMTDYGIQRIKLRPYQIKVLRAFQENRFNVFLASRQIGKTVCSAIFITWYLLFNVEKNVMVLANRGGTAAEILDKIKAVVKGLPFFMKPGVLKNNVMEMRFDNGCRVMGQATTKTAAIGFTIHLAYMDEFAHIQASFLEPFYRSVYPTISSSQISRVIITSTPNGKNKFYDIYSNAVKKKNEYNAIRVDWWEVPGRDEAWKKREISQLGSEELFNQEYGNQFLAGERRLLGENQLRFLRKIMKPFVFREIEEFEDSGLDYSDLKWHPDFNLNEIEDSQFALSIDLSDGVGMDFSIINIFRVVPMSKASLRRMPDDRVTDEGAAFRLRQVGILKTNRKDVEELSKLARVLIFKVLGADRTKVSIEMNFKGDYFVEKLSQDDDFYEDIFVHTRHSEKSKFESLGIKIRPQNKMLYCRGLRKLVLERRIVMEEESSVEEMDDFSINSRGSYSSQSGHDDISMTAVNLVPYFSSDAFTAQVEEKYDQLDDDLKAVVREKISQESTGKGGDDLSYLKDMM